MALSLRSLGRIDEAIDHFSQAVRFKPNFVAAHNNLAHTFVMAGRFDSALEHFYEALRLKPDSAAALSGIASILVNHPDPAVRDPNRAIEFASRAAALTGYNDSVVLETLAAAFAAAGQFDRAAITLQIAVDLASAGGDDEFAARLRRELHRYKQSRPDAGSKTER
jgi:spermidine synthase